MSGQARVGDYVVISCPHGGIGVIVTGSNNVFGDGKPEAKVGDKVICLVCGQSGTITSGSSTTFINGNPAAKIGDNTSGTCSIGLPCCSHGRQGTIIQGSSDIFTS